MAGRAIRATLRCFAIAAALRPQAVRAESVPEPADAAPAPPGTAPEVRPQPQRELQRREAATAMAAASSTTGSIGSSPRGAALDWMVMPSGYDLGGSLRFAMSPSGALSERPLRFTDLGLFDVHGRIGLNAGFEVAANTTLAVKQPSDADEKLWQASRLTLRWQPGMPTDTASDRTPEPNCTDCNTREGNLRGGKPFVLGLGAGAGPMLDDLGTWTAGSLSIASRKRVVGDSTGGLQFEGSLGSEGLFLVPRRGDSTALVEAQMALGLLAHVGRRGRGGGGAAVWLMSSFAVPVWHRGDDPVSDMPLDPQTRLGFAIGAMATLTGTWDLIFEMRATDRGDLEFARTRLPIMDGGFDSRQLVFAVTYHGEFSSKKPRRDPLILIP